MARTKRTVWGTAVIASVVLLAYFPALKIDFIVPDWWFLNNAARLDFLQHVTQYFDVRLQTYGFRPLQGFQFFFEYLLFRDDRTGYHLFHILFHLLNCLLLFAIVRQISQRWRLAFLAALAYATLPAYSLAVMWIGVTDPITAIFFLLTILFWSMYLPTRRATLYVLTIGAFGMTMMGKEISVLLPPILFLIEHWVIGAPFKFTAAVRRYAVFALLLIPYLLYEYTVQRSGAFVTMAGYSFGPHIGSNLAQYLAVFVAPWLLSAPTDFINYVWLGFVVLLFGIATLRTRSRALLFLGVAPLLVILPVLGFEPVWFDARYLYIPLLAGAVLLALAIEKSWQWFYRFSARQWLYALGLGGFLIANSLIIAGAAGGWAEITRQRRVPFRDIVRQHPTWEPKTYLYFLESKQVPLYDLSVMFLLKYGTGLVVEGIDMNQIPRWRDFSQAFLYYFDETGKPVENVVERSLRLETSPAMPIDFAAPIRLEGLDVVRGNIKRGDSLVLLLYWRAMGEIDQDYTVFAHLIDAQGQTIAGHDSQPRSGDFPTSHWNPNQLIVDAIHIPIDENTPLGEYRVAIGLYHLPTQQRIGIVDTNGRTLADALMVQPINVIK